MRPSSPALTRGLGCLFGAAAACALYACSGSVKTAAAPRPHDSAERASPAKTARARPAPEPHGRATGDPDGLAASEPDGLAASVPDWRAADAPATVAARLVVAQRSVEEFFGRPFPRPYEVHVLPDRAAFSRFVKERWDMPETQCWMVAAGTASVMVMIDPVAWKTEACEHDPSDERHVQQLLTHELVHVFHGQHSPRPEFDGMDDLGWFVEGLAVYASGQLDESRRREAREAIAKGKAPERLEDAWSGRYRYAVCGSLAAFVDERLGREKLLGLLGATQEGEFLSALGMSEAELLEGWRKRETRAP